MYIEYVCYDYSLSDEEIKNNVALAIQLGIKHIGLHYINISLIKGLIEEHSLTVSAPSDYPYGLLDPKSRLSIIGSAIKAGAKTIDLVAPAKLIANRKYDKLRDDIKNSLALCQENNVDLRYILEYRVFNHETLAKTCQILKNLGIQYILPATGHMLDDISDNMIACKYLSAKSQIQTICNGNIWTEKQSEILRLSNIYGVRLHHISSIALFLKNNTL
jgi:deoxyribose-phosphate aldolase